PDTSNNGGGIWAFDIACDGTLGTPARLGTIETPDAIDFLHGAPGQAVLASGATLGSPATDDVHWIDLSGAAPSLLGSAPVFADHQALASAVAVTEDDAYALVADNGIFAGSRVGVARLDGSGLAAVGELSGVRQVQFLPDGGIEDLGVRNGSGFEALVGAVGVQP